ncbi:MAG TPA: hemolysin family protein [Acidimicrobiales bacterium]|jgi:CBS domain containing-hemolysin-like protein|nr:hemolysin family protein [Acidimicrobiales bacterium]
MNVVATIALLVANAFFVAVEFALITSRRTVLQPLAEGGDRRATLALRASRSLSLELAGAQLGVTMSSLLLGFVTEPMVSAWLESLLGVGNGLPDRLVHTLGFILALVIVSFLHMVIGEMVPKNIAIAAPERALLWLAIPDRVYVFVFGPVIRALNWAANGVTRLLGVQPRDELHTVHSADEIALLLESSADEGLIPEFEHDLLAGVLGFGEAPISEVMVPWAQVTTVGRETTVAGLEGVFVASGHSRVPVVATDGRRVLGFLHAKDLLALPVTARERPLPLGRLRRMLIARPDWTLDQTLLAMQRARIHIAVVREGPDPVGLVTLEDLLEQLVGDILDESDLERPRPSGEGGREARR